MMQVSKKIPFDDPDVLNYVRGIYVASNIIICGLYLYVQDTIRRNNGMPSRTPSAPRPTSGLSLLSLARISPCRPSHANSTPLPRKTDMTTIKYVEPAPMGSADTEGKLVTTTIYQYDMDQLRTLFRGQLVGVMMMAFMHLYMKYTQPLLIQSILPIKGAFESNMVKIHVYGWPATGDLKRPFKAAAGIMGAMQGGAVQSDKKAVEAAERAGRGGVKEE